MLTAHHLSKTYGIQPILQDISFSISAGERIGLIGPNGSGKTTLMRILAGLETPDEGTVTQTRPQLRIGYLAQGMDLDPEQTLRATLGFATVSESELASEIASLAAALASNPNDAMIQEKYDSALHQISNLQSPLSTLASLGLSNLSLDTPIAHLSGGQKTRLMLARLLLEEPQLLLLDEPTNHLDIAMLEWLEGWLTRFQGAALIVSHDRAFLDNTVASILELDPKTHTLHAYPGNYSDYIETKQKEYDKQYQEYRDQVNEIKKLHNAARHLRRISQFKVGGKGDTRDKFAKGFFGDRTTHTARRALRIEQRIEKVLDEDRKEKPIPSWGMKLDFGAPAHQSKDVLSTENLSVDYPGHEPLLEGLNLYVRARQRIALTGENGSGKTTLLRTIAGKLEPLAGTVRLGQAVRLGYLAQEQELLDPSLSALETIQGVAAFNETQARHFLHFFLFSGDDPLRPSGELSFGERARLQLALLVAQGCTFLLLDEPINHLDIPSRARFEQALTQFNGSILAVVHDRYFIERFASEVWTVKAGKVEKWM
jgi:ATP-binding cassette subfamily F protein 3